MGPSSLPTPGVRGLEPELQTPSSYDPGLKDPGPSCLHPQYGSYTDDAQTGKGVSTGSSWVPPGEPNPQAGPRDRAETPVHDHHTVQGGPEPEGGCNPLEPSEDFLVHTTKSEVAPRVEGRGPDVRFIPQSSHGGFSSFLPSSLFPLFLIRESPWRGRSALSGRNPWRFLLL